MQLLKVLLDTNVVLDKILLRDEPDFFSAEIFLACVEGSVEGYVAALSFSHIAYILRKRYMPDEIREVNLNLCRIFNVIGLDKSNVVSASLNYGFSDFEDSLQYEYAKKIEADYIITNNVKDFYSSGIRFISPAGFVKIIKTAQAEE